MPHTHTIVDVRHDLHVLERMLDALLDDGHSDDDPLLRACDAVVRDRRRRLENLESGVGVTQTV